MWLVGVAVRRYNNNRYPHNNNYFSLYTPLVLALFAAALLHRFVILKMFFRSLISMVP